MRVREITARGGPRKSWRCWASCRMPSCRRGSAGQSRRSGSCEGDFSNAAGVIVARVVDARAHGNGRHCRGGIRLQDRQQVVCRADFGVQPEVITWIAQVPGPSTKR
jgi:hypothetical protein